MRIVRSHATQPRPRRGNEHGQAIVLFAFVLLGIVAMAGLLIDGGLTWSNRRQAQGAADTAALAAAKAIINGGDANTAAQLIAQLNGFLAGKDCSGKPFSLQQAVQVNNPPSSGQFAGNPSYVEVITTRAMYTTFSGALGVTCFMVSARAVAQASVITGVAQCSFCSLNSSTSNHTLVLKNSATLRVDGDIIVNSSNGGYTPGSCFKLVLYFVCGDGFDIFGAGGNISAQRVSVHGGWETHDLNIARADGLAPGCVDRYDPPAYSGANVCIHMPLIADPFNDPFFPGNAIADPPPDPGLPSTGLGCQLPAAPGTTLAITAGSATLCPGRYDGGILIGGSANVTMVGGVYYIAGGGFTVSGDSSVDGSAGVMIYNGSGGGGGSSSTDPAYIDNLPRGAPFAPALPTLTASTDPLVPGQGVTFTFSVCGSSSCTGTPLLGKMTFFDGSTPICANVAVGNPGGSKATGSCTTSFPDWGTREITAVYCPPTIASCVPPWAGFNPAVDQYNPIGSLLTETITAPTNTPLAPISITTNGVVKLYGPTSGAYGGLTIFQTRANSATITLSPGGSVGACNGSWMTIGVPDGDAPPACGAIGGLRGTIYAGNQNALVYVTASGLANLQIIAGKVRIDSGANARFAYRPEFFANGSIRLIE